jgi:hypothetical protein
MNPMRANQPFEPGAGRVSDRQSGGGRGWILCGIGILALAFNHWRATSDGKVSFWFLLFGPLFVLLGLGTVYDFRVFKAVGKDAKSVPTRFRVIGALLVTASLVISGWLAFGYYRIN